MSIEALTNLEPTITAEELAERFLEWADGMTALYGNSPIYWLELWASTGEPIDP